MTMQKYVCKQEKIQLLVDKESFITQGVKAGECCIFFYKDYIK